MTTSAGDEPLFTTLRITREAKQRIKDIARTLQEPGSRARTANDIVVMALDALKRERERQQGFQDMMGMLQK